MIKVYARRKQIPANKPVLAWHWLTNEGYPAHGSLGKVRKGQVLHEESIWLCHRGLHACTNPLNALTYARGLVVERVLLWGHIESDGTKFCAQHRKCLWKADATHVIYKFINQKPKGLSWEYRDEFEIIDDGGRRTGKFRPLRKRPYKYERDIIRIARGTITSSNKQGLKLERALLKLKPK